MQTNGTDQEFEHYDRSIRKHGMQEMTRTSKVVNSGYEKLAESAARGSRATVWGIAVSSVLAAIKIVGGILGNSYALIADGIESMLDILSSLVVWGSLQYSTQPADEEHPYGYGKVEPLAALVVATALFAAAVGNP
jgi:divalent metal cation (Fe/Co/Zn/Cd) transporter